MKNSNRQTESESIYKKTLFQYIPGILIPAFTNIFLSVGLARFLSVELYGEYTYFLSIGTIIISLLSQWLVQSILKYHNSNRDNDNYYSIINILGSLFFVVFAISSFLWITSFITQINTWNIYISIMAFCASQILIGISVSVYSAEYKAKLVKEINIQQAFLKLGLLVIYLLYRNNYRIDEIFIIFTVANILSLLTDKIRNKKEKSIRIINFEVLFSRRKFHKSTFYKLFTFGLPMTGWFIGTNLMGVGDRIVLKMFTDMETVGIYSANYSLVSMGIGLLVSPFLQSAHPIIMNFGQDKINSKVEVALFIEKLSRNFLTISIGIIVCLFFYYEKISILFFGTEYLSGAIVIPITTLGIFFWNYSMYGHKGLEIMNQPMKMMRFVLYAALLNVVLNFILIPFMGIKGSAVATLIAYLSYAFMIKINSKNNIKWIINIRHIIICILIFTIPMFLFKPVLDIPIDWLISIIDR